MAVKLRLVRMGKKKQPTYRVVAADSRSPRDGRFLEIVGTYAPRGRSTAEPDAVVKIDNDKALKWLRQGAQPTERVEKLLQDVRGLGRVRGGQGQVSAAADDGADEGADEYEAGDVNVADVGRTGETTSTSDGDVNTVDADTTSTTTTTTMTMTTSRVRRSATRRRRGRRSRC